MLFLNRTRVALSRFRFSNWVALSRADKAAAVSGPRPSAGGFASPRQPLAAALTAASGSPAPSRLPPTGGGSGVWVADWLRRASVKGRRRVLTAWAPRTPSRRSLDLVVVRHINPLRALAAAAARCGPEPVLRRQRWGREEAGVWGLKVGPGPCDGRSLPRTPVGSWRQRPLAAGRLRPRVWGGGARWAPTMSLAECRSAGALEVKFVPDEDVLRHIADDAGTAGPALLQHLGWLPARWSLQPPQALFSAPCSRPARLRGRVAAARALGWGWREVLIAAARWEMCVWGPCSGVPPVRLSSSREHTGRIKAERGPGRALQEPRAAVLSACSVLELRSAGILSTHLCEVQSTRSALSLVLLWAGIRQAVFKGLNLNLSVGVLTAVT